MISFIKEENEFLAYIIFECKKKKKNNNLKKKKKRKKKKGEAHHLMEAHIIIGGKWTMELKKSETL